MEFRIWRMFLMEDTALKPRLRQAEDGEIVYGFPYTLNSRGM